MNRPHQHQNPKNCQKHNQPIILFDQQSNKSLCLTCVQEKTGMLPIDQIQQQQQEIKSQSDKEYEDEKQQLQLLLDSILKYKQNVINGIDKIIQIIIDQIKNIDQFKEKFDQQLTSSNQLNTLNEIKGQLKNQEDHHKQVKIKIQSLLSEFQQKYKNIDDLNQILISSPKKIEEQLNNQTERVKIVVQEVKQEMIYDQRKFQYELIRQFGIKESDYCHAFAFKKDNTILIVGCRKTIKIYEFLNGKIGKELQVLSNHNDLVYCLYYMQKSSCFVSGSRDYSIIIWKNKNKNNQWSPSQILKDHQDTIYCLLMNKNEDLLISGSEDETVKFWKQVNDKWSCYQTIQTDNKVWAMSLNEMENKLITCGNGAYIYVMEINDDDKQWSVKQKINVTQFGYRLCFTFGDQFVFQPITKDYLEVFANQFKKLSQVQIQSCQDCTLLFPCQYIKSLNILFVKHGPFLNIFKVNEEKNYELIQTIQYEHQYGYGTVSNDGQHLITWNRGSKEIQVRRLKLIND